MSCKYKYEGVIYTEEEITNILDKNIVVFKGALKGFYDSQTKSIFLTEEFLSSESLVHEAFHAFEPAIDLAAAKGDKTAITLLKELDRVIDESQMFNEQETIERYNNSKNFGANVDPMISFKVPTFTDNTDIDRVKDLPITSDEDGATFNLDGTSYKGKGLVVPVISLNTTQKGLSKELIAKFVTDNADKIGNDSVKVGIYKFKESDEVSIDLNIVVNPEYKEVALAFGKFAGQKSLFNLDNFQDEPTGETGANPKTFTSEEFIEISNSLSKGELPNFMNITPQNSSNYTNLTEDGKGNFVFYHRGNSGYKTIRKSSGGTLATSKEEAQALAKVGGLAMYYTRYEDGESSVTGESKYMVKIPMSKVYDFNTDNLNIVPKAKELHAKEHPNKAFDVNTQVAYVTKLAYELGYDMVVAQWKNITRAQSFRELAPIDVQLTRGNTIIKFFTGDYNSNSKKGYKSVIPVLKQDKLQELYLEMNIETNKDSKYSDSAYGLHHEVGSKKLTQEEVTNRVNNSSIPQELKDRYFEVIQEEEQPRKSILDFSAQSSQAYAPRQGESQNEYVKRMRREVAANLLGENSVAYFDRIAEENNLTGKQKASFINKVKAFIKKFSNWLAKQIGFENLTPEEASKLTNKDVLDRITTSILKGQFNEVDSNTLLRYITNQNKTQEKLTKEQTVDLQDFNNFDKDRLLNAFYDNDGVFSINEIKLLKSKLYKPYEVSKIVNDVDLQATIKDSLERLRNTDVDIDEVEQERGVTNEFNSFGKLVASNSFLAEKREADDAITMSDNEFQDNYSKEKNKDYKPVEVLVEVNGEIRQRRNTETELMLPITAKETENTKVQALLDIRFESLQDNEVETRDVLNQIEDELIKDSIDVIGLSQKPIDESLLNYLTVLNTFIKAPSEKNTRDFANLSDEYFERDLSPKKELIKGEQYKEYVKLETTLSEEDVYNQQGLIKLDDTTYIKTAKEDLETLYNNLKTYTEKYTSTLEEYVQEQLKNYNFKNAEVAEAIILYKMYFGVDSQKSVFKIKREEDRTEIKLPKIGSIIIVETTPEYEFKEDLTDFEFDKLGIDEDDFISKIEHIEVKDKNKGKGYGKKLMSEALKNIQTFPVYLNASPMGSDGLSLYDLTEFYKSFGFKVIKNQGGNNLMLLKEEDLIIETTNTPIKQTAKFTGDYNYITERFPSDFYSDYLAQKKLNSKLFRNFYSNFEVNEKGIKLINIDEASLRNVKIYADENLKQYSLLSKQMPDLSDNSESIINPRDEAVNNPKTIKEFTGQVSKMNQNEIVVRNSSESIIRIGNDVFESFAKEGNLNHFVKLEVNNSDYLQVGTQAVQSNLNIKNYDYLNETPEKFKTIKDYLKGEMPEELNC